MLAASFALACDKSTDDMPLAEARLSVGHVCVREQVASSAARGVSKRAACCGRGLLVEWRSA